MNTETKPLRTGDLSSLAFASEQEALYLEHFGTGEDVRDRIEKLYARANAFYAEMSRQLELDLRPELAQCGLLI